MAATETFEISREIGIDMGHRVTYHGSKCRNLHGHRYKIHAICDGPLISGGEQDGMVLDFGFLKDEMMQQIDEVHDHGTTLWVQDPLLGTFIGDENVAVCADHVLTNGYDMPLSSITGKLCVVPFVPTAENLAKFWFDHMVPRVAERSGNMASLKRIDVWETPNCMASYSRPVESSVHMDWLSKRRDLTPEEYKAQYQMEPIFDEEPNNGR